MITYTLATTVFATALGRRLRVTPQVQADSPAAALSILTQRLRDQQQAGQVAWFTYPVIAG